MLHIPPGELTVLPRP